MSEVMEVDRFPILKEEIQEIVAKLNQLHDRVKLRSHESSQYNTMQRVSLVKESLNIQRIADSLCSDLMSNQLSEPSDTANHMWHIIELHSTSPDAVIEGTHLLEHFLELKMHSMIEPTNYLDTIAAYVRWENETVRYFVDRFKEKPRNSRLNKIARIWNWNYRKNEKIFFGGAARPLHLKKVTRFSALMNFNYDLQSPLYKQNRNSLFDALKILLHQEGRIYWPDYELFPHANSNTIIDKCLHYFFFKDRKNTWFMNSSASDYIPFVSSAREVFAEKFNGSRMTSPDQHNTEWILDDLKRRCLNIYCQQNNENKPTIIILLTSKNRFGHRIDVDWIHSKLSQQFSSIVTIVDGCQDAQSFTQVDIVVYTKRFTTTGAIGLVSKTLLMKNTFLRKKLTVGTNFPVGILAQLYVSINMANTGLAHGLEELVNSSWWDFWQCPIQHELHSVFEYPYAYQQIVEHLRGPIRYSFTEDPIGTILILTLDNDGQLLLPKLWAFLKKQGHSLDCFVLDNPYLRSHNAVYSDKVRELISGKFIEELRQIEVLSSDYLVWPLVPFWISSPDDLSVEELNAHFNICYAHHCCLRISVGRCGYPGKLKRFVEYVDSIFERNELNISDEALGKHSSQWPA